MQDFRGESEGRLYEKFLDENKMIDLTQTLHASPQLHDVPCDPGTTWQKDVTAAIDAPPDEETDPQPESQWLPDQARTGIFGAVTPRVLRLPDGGYRSYYTQILPRPRFPAGANDYGNASSRILSAASVDGEQWTPEPGIRLTPQAGEAGEFRVVVTDVVPLPVGDSRLRMYYECAPGPQSGPSAIRSAISEDGGLTWEPEPGTRFCDDGTNYASARIVFLDDGLCRLYCCHRGLGIVSAISTEGGTTFEPEPGVRIAQDRSYDATVAFAPEVVTLPTGDYVMYYAGYASAKKAYILRAASDDGLEWHKDPEPVISPGGRWDAAKCSEMCIYYVPGSADTPACFRMLYEACDGTAADQRGVWRVASAVSTQT
jgi:hypothetical protein